tara:strand:- start:420 stop:530 length:111 start_codon:yes stop_codon:yes gene_type:complete
MSVDVTDSITPDLAPKKPDPTPDPTYVMKLGEKPER